MSGTVCTIWYGLGGDEESLSRLVKDCGMQVDAIRQLSTQFQELMQKRLRQTWRYVFGWEI